MCSSDLELLIPLFCPLGTRARFVPITQKVEFSLFLIFFLPFGAVSSKAHG